MTHPPSRPAASPQPNPDVEPAGTSVEDTLQLARAIGTLVLVLRQTEAAVGAGANRAAANRDALRRGLRLTVAAARRTPLAVALSGGVLHLNGQPLTPDVAARDVALDALIEGLASQGSLTLDVRQSAAPAELLALARVLAADPHGPADSTAWRSWSVRITPQSVPAVPEDDGLPASLRDAIARLAGARGDAATRGVVDELLSVRSVPAWSDSPAVAEALALTLVGEARARGSRGGRLALESGLRRLMTAPLVRTLVRQLAASRRREELLSVLSRAGDVAVSELVTHLQDAESVAERRVCFDAIVALDAGDEALREALTDPRWYVVRNSAALLGEMGVVEADVHLIPLLEHHDERLRIAAARALTRLGTPKALQALQGRLADSASEVRRLAVTAFGARRKEKQSTGALLAAFDRETDEDVLLEILTVFGQLASPECVQRLVRIYRDENHEPWVRQTAYQALLAARGDLVSRLLDA
jgi:HEAT repeat protein